MPQVPILNLEIAEIKDFIYTKLEEPKAQRKLVLVIVAIALLLDNMLYMVIVPIIPDYLRKIGSWDTHIEGGEAVTEPPRRIFFSNSTGNYSYYEPSVKTSRLINGVTVYEGEDAAIGVLFASKAMIQLLINPFSGAIIDRIGYDKPMMVGLTIMFFSTAVFAIGSSYSVLFFARSLQGVGSAFADTSGLAMIASVYTEEAERSKALGIALAFISFGCLVAPPFGGLMYELAGKEVPFLILSFVCLIDGIMLWLVMKPIKKQQKEQGVERPAGTPIWILFMDPYIAVCSGALIMANVSLAFLEPTISVWMMDTMNASQWEQGSIWFPAFFPHVLGVVMTVKIAAQYPQYQWIMAGAGLALEGLCSLMVPFAKSYWVLIIPISGICFGIALIDTALLPTLGYLVDLRYVSVYGSIYAIADISYSFAYAFGPIIAGRVMENIGFTGLNIIIAVTNLGWRGSVSKFSDRILTRASSVVTSGFGQTQNEDRQPNLPKLPVPDLEKTLQRYLEAIEPILSKDDFETAQKLSAHFLENNGPLIQHELENKRLELKNWAYEFWLNDMYMNNTLCLPINSNPGGVMPRQDFKNSQREQLLFATQLTSYMLDWKERLDKNEIEVEKALSREPGQPLCMAQHYRLMTTCRIPGELKDAQRDTSNCLVDHIIVAYKKNFYSCPISTVKRRLTSVEIFNQFKTITESLDESCDNIGILTTEDRRTWGKVRAKLLEDEINKQSLEELETCYFIICLDEPLPVYFNSKLKSCGRARDETNFLHEMIHGGGSSYNTPNRWFDKTMQFVICSDGAVGICYEHSPAEGIGILNIIDEFIKKKDEKELEIDESLEIESKEEISKPIRLEWAINDEINGAITNAASKIDILIQDLDLEVVRFESYGKNFIKKSHVSPDVYLQLALQLAYHKAHGKMVATYESGSTRRFKLGRVDCIRSTTNETLAWVKSMSLKTSPNKMELFHAAVEKQTGVMIENIMGEGIDIHLLGLREAGREMGLGVHELFTHSSFATANYFGLSTSQLPTKENQFMGYGPVVPDGYGASYNPQPDSIIFCISSFKSSSLTSTTNYVQALHAALSEMKELLEQ